MVLGMSAGTIREGNTDGAEGEEVIDEAAVAHKLSSHVHLDRDGTVCDWNNTADFIAWEIEFPEKGSYDVFLATQTRWAQQPWDGKREMEVEWNGQRIVSTLNRDQDFSTSHRRKYESRLGVLNVEAGERGMLILRTLRIGSKEAGALNLASLRLVRK